MVVHGDKLRWLAWLRVKILLRGFQRRPSMLVFTLIGLIVLLIGGGALSLGIFAVFSTSSTVAATEMLYLLFSGMLLFWIVLPLLSYSTNEGLDVTKLQLFPLTRLEVMFSLLFSSLFDIWTVLLLLLFIATIVAWWLHSLALGLMALLVVVVFYVVMVSISQLILALLMRTLQSRRFRDLSVLIIALFGSSCYLFSRLDFGTKNIGGALRQGAFSPYLQWSPAGVAASSLRSAVQGNWGISFALLGLLVVICAVALYLWQIVLERSMSASESGASRRGKRRQQAAVASPVAMPARASAVVAHPGIERARGEVRVSAPVREETDPLKANLFEQLQALVKKELICFWRDPQLKIRIFQSLFYVVIVIFIPLLSQTKGNGSGGRFEAQYEPFYAAAVSLLLMLVLSLNTLGIERQSLTALFLFPIDRRRLLWGKNLAVLLLGLVELIVLMGVCIALGRQPQMVLPALVMGLAGMGVALGCGNLVSVFFPRYQREMGRRGFAGSGSQAQQGGCLNQLMALVALVATVIVLAPVALGIGIPFFMGNDWSLVVSIPLSLLYGLALYVIFTNLSARRMLATEPEILKATTRE